jgi:microcystin-dependent protein
MPYEIKFTDYVNKLQIVVEDNTINNETSLKLPGKNTTAYGSLIAENFLHLLENFASTTPPSVPVEGQLWYNSTEDVEQLFVYTGVNWSPANGVNKSTNKPDFAQEGDLWIDKENLQLYMYTNASGWVLIGPEFSEGLITGATPRIVLGTDNLSYNVLQIDVNSSPVAIVTNKSFTPKSKIDGFTTLGPGINLTNKSLFGEETLKYRGIAEKAENVIINNEVIPAGKLLRTDIVNSINYPINVLSNSGINYGINNELSIGIQGTSSVIKNNVSGSQIELQTRFGGLFSTVLTVNSQKKVGINSVNPDHELEVVGDIKVSVPLSDANKGGILVDSTKESDKFTNHGSITTLGGIGVAKSITIGSNLYLPNTETSYIEANKLIPTKDADELIGTQESFIGSNSLRYNGIYAKRFYGDLEGNVTGSISGRAGSASKLAKSSAFSFIGDITIDAENNNNEITIPFTGTGEAIIFPVKIAQSFISNSCADHNHDLLSPGSGLVEVFDDDDLLLSRNREDIGLHRVSIESIIDKVPKMPIGTIVPFAGDQAPSGWLLCNGRQILIADYLNLYNVIGYLYLAKDFVQQGRFALPDMRGRFPLGMHNMGGEIPADIRVSDPIANELGKNSGTETKTLDVDNLPDHSHTLKYQDHQFYATNEQQFSLQDNAVDEFPHYEQFGEQTGYGLKKTGGIDAGSITSFSQPFDVMNPFLVLNYIIYAG